MAFMQRDVRRREVQTFGDREGTQDKSMPGQRWLRGEDIILSLLLGGDHSTSDYIGKGGD